MVRLFTFTTAILSLFLAAQSVTADPPANTAGQDTDIRSPLDFVRTVCTAFDGHPTEIAKIFASAENALVGGNNGPGQGVSVTPVQSGVSKVEKFCNNIKNQPEYGPLDQSSKNSQTDGSADPPANTAGQDTDIRSPADFVRTACTLFDGHPTEVAKIFASAENALVGGNSGSGKGVPLTPVQSGVTKVEKFCNNVKNQPEYGPLDQSSGNSQTDGR
ncbi:hypothetical protein LRAMOSA03160 [Lichtheimia ramosa]|uniref:Uncharacterized protein n=1 Tax=Lichtheimia ramosa TaxID=688394 RepID=A0A077WTB1_9FUNG|nr:hypothetical protein LRAMOSA03160 [Lichtheimia ramosa]